MISVSAGFLSNPPDRCAQLRMRAESLGLSFRDGAIRCPLDGAALAGLQAARGRPRVLIHQSGRRHPIPNDDR